MNAPTPADLAAHHQASHTPSTEATSEKKSAPNKPKRRRDHLMQRPFENLDLSKIFPDVKIVAKTNDDDNFKPTKEVDK